MFINQKGYIFVWEDFLIKFLEKVREWHKVLKNINDSNFQVCRDRDNNILGCPVNVRFSCKDFY